MERRKTGGSDKALLTESSAFFVDEDVKASVFETVSTPAAINEFFKKFLRCISKVFKG
jgi:hypothetical protein